MPFVPDLPGDGDRDPEGGDDRAFFAERASHGAQQGLRSHGAELLKLWNVTLLSLLTESEYLLH